MSKDRLSLQRTCLRCSCGIILADRNTTSIWCLRCRTRTGRGFLSLVGGWPAGTTGTLQIRAGRVRWLRPGWCAGILRRSTIGKNRERNDMVHEPGRSATAGNTGRCRTRVRSPRTRRVLVVRGCGQSAAGVGARSCGCTDDPPPVLQSWVVGVTEVTLTSLQWSDTITP